MLSQTLTEACFLPTVSLLLFRFFLSGFFFAAFSSDPCEILPDLTALAVDFGFCFTGVANDADVCSYM